MFDFGPNQGDPDLASHNPGPGPLCATTATGGLCAIRRHVQDGVWFAMPSECGPYPGPAPAGTVELGDDRAGQAVRHHGQLHHRRHHAGWPSTRRRRSAGHHQPGPERHHQGDHQAVREVGHEGARHPLCRRLGRRRAARTASSPATSWPGCRTPTRSSNAASRGGTGATSPAGPAGNRRRLPTSRIIATAGQLWPARAMSFAIFPIGPGQTRTITVTISTPETPRAPSTSAAPATSTTSFPRPRIPAAGSGDPSTYTVGS